VRKSLKKGQGLPLSHSFGIPEILVVCTIAACLALVIMVSASPILWVRAQEPPEELLGEERPSFQGMKAYFGDLHQHSGYSDREACGLPAEAYERARSRGNDFLGLVEHHYSWGSPYIGAIARGCRLPELEQDKWGAALETANAANEEGVFVALRGYEWVFSGSRYGGPVEPHMTAGHMNIFNSDVVVAPTELMDIYNWLAGQPMSVVAHLNHPDRLGIGLGDHDDYMYHAGADARIWGIEADIRLEYYKAYPVALNRGWDISPVGYGDGLHTNVAGYRRYGVFAPDITRSDLIEALSANRTFGCSHPDQSRLGELAVAFLANGHWMGSTIPRPGRLDFEVYVADRSGDEIESIELLSRSHFGVVARVEPQVPASPYIWRFTIDDLDGYDYFYVQARDRDGEMAWSAPIRLSDRTCFRVQPSYLVFRTSEEGEVPSPQAVYLNSNDGGALEWRVVEELSWIEITPTVGVTLPQTLTVSVNRDGVQPGLHAGSIRLEKRGDPSVAWVVGVVFDHGGGGNTLSPEARHLSVSSYLVEFEFEKGSPTGTRQIEVTTDREVWSWDSWTDVDWIVHSPVSSTSSCSITVSVDDSDLTPGWHDGHLTITGGDRTWTVTVRVHLWPEGVQTVTLQDGLNGYEGTEDTYLDCYDKEASHSDAWTLHLRPGCWTPLIRFDLAGLPPGAIPHEATLELYFTERTVDHYMVASGYQLLRPWDEEEATWTNASRAVGWDSPGATGEGDSAQGMSCERFLIGEWSRYRFEVTELVRQWMDDPGTNSGLLLRGAGVGSGYGLRSSEYHRISERPKLTIHYTLAQPTITPTATTSPTATAMPTVAPSPTATPLPGICVPLVLR